VSAHFTFPIRVYWEDTDAGGVVYYANYLRFMERARSEWLRSLGVEQDALRDELGVVFVVRRVEIDYLAPARFNDALRVTVRLTGATRTTLTVTQQVASDAPRARALVRLACVDAASFKPARIPASILEKLPIAP